MVKLVIIPFDGLDRRLDRPLVVGCGTGATPIQAEGCYISFMVYLLFFQLILVKIGYLTP